MPKIERMNGGSHGKAEYPWFPTTKMIKHWEPRSYELSLPHGRNIVKLSKAQAAEGSKVEPMFSGPSTGHLICQCWGCGLAHGKSLLFWMVFPAGNLNLGGGFPS